MPRRFALLLGLLISSASLVHAADDSKASAEPTVPDVIKKTPLNLDELRVPISPAFTLLGVTPTEIERPSTARAFAVGLLSASERANGELPANLAIELAPYWWTDKPKLTFDEYYRANPGQRMAQSFAISLASSELSTYRQDENAKGTALALGARTMILGGKKNPELQRAVDALVRQLDDLDACVPFIDPKAPAPPPDAKVVGQITVNGVTHRESTLDLSPACETALQSIKSRALRVSTFDRERVGLVLEAAGGAVMEVPKDDASDKRTAKYGGWLTWSYRSSGAEDLDTPSALTVVAVQRWLRDDISSEDAIDVGARLIYKSTDNQWTVSGEYLKRFADETGDSSSSRITLEYALSERYTLTAALGRNFRTGDKQSPLIAIAGLSIGWGGATMKTR